MNSPFPGMDPYLEPFWKDVHTRMILYASDQIFGRLPSDMTARVEQSLQIDGADEDDIPTRSIYFPDVLLLEQANYAENLKAAVSGTMTLVPIRLKLPEPTGRTLRIRTSAGELVTAIEFLSPGNRGSLASKRQFQGRQQALRAAHVNLVEVFLLRGRDYPLSLPMDEIPESHAEDYKVAIVRGASPLEADFYPISIRTPLPTIPIPLRKHEPETYLELQPLIDLAYKNGNYGKTDYSQPPPVSLGPDAAWADELLKARP